MATYNIKFTDINKTPIVVDQGDLDITSVDVALFGRIKLEYGELLNENLLHLLENFACPEDSANPGNPDLSIALEDTLSHPTAGQFWYNSSQEVPFVWDDIQTKWVAVGSSADFAANSGKILHGQQLPLPVSPSGYQFGYRECIWIVSPSGIQQTTLGNNGFSYMVCTTDKNGLLNHQYGQAGTNILVSGVANYLILGMRNSNPVSDPNPHHHNYAELAPPPPPAIQAAVPSPTPSVTPTPAAAASPTPTPTAAATVTPTVTVSPTVTPTPTATRAPSITPSASPQVPISAVLYINPSLGYAQNFGGGSAMTGCVTSGSNLCKQSLGVSVANIFGGNGGPYTVTYQLSFFYSVIATSLVLINGQSLTGQTTTAPVALPPTSYSPTTSTTYTGSSSGYTVNVSGSFSGITTGSGIKSSSYVVVNWNKPAAMTKATATVTLLAGSRVIITDGAGNSIIYYTPGGSSGQVLGTSLTQIPASNYTDSYSIT
jgi:hypothetical protein